MQPVESIFNHIVSFIEIVSAIILLVGFLKAGWGFSRSQFRKNGSMQRFDEMSQLRLQLGTYILLGLDFYIVSDILYSMIRPELHELLNLALIVVLRTTIGYFLSRELSEIEKPRITRDANI